MIRKFHNHTLPINPLHREDEPQNTNSHKTPERQSKQTNQLSRLQSYNGHQTLHDKTRTKHRQAEQQQQTTNHQQQNYRIRKDSRLSHLGSLNAFYWRQIFALDSTVVKLLEIGGYTKTFSVIYIHL